MAFNPFGYSNAQSKPFTETPEYEKYRYQYGQSPTGASDAVSNAFNREAAVEERTAPQMQGTQLDQGAANQTRDIQMGSLANLQSAAAGGAPSAAENLARQGIDRSLRAQTSAAGNVRGGPGAAASAYRYASQNAAQQRADMNQGIQAERANEIATARGQLATAGTAVRGQDLTAATTNAQLGQDANKTNATLQLQGRALNDQRAQQYEDLQNKINEDQLNANLQQQGIVSGVRQNADRLNTETNQHNADRTWDVTKGLVGAAQGVVGGITKALSDPNSKMPIFGSLASLDLGGRKTAHGVGGGTELDQSGGMSHDTLLAAGSGLSSPQPVQGMVGGGGVTGGYVPTGEDGSGAGLSMSDEKTKEAPQTYGVDEDRSSPTFRSWLARSTKGAPGEGGAVTKGAEPVKSRSALIEEIERSTADAKPYDRDPEVAKGVAGAPRGYANGRGAPEEDNVSWSKPGTWGMYRAGKAGDEASNLAPGTDDYERTGGDAAKKGEVDWNHGGAIAKPEGKPGVFEALFGGLANARPFGAAPPPDAARDTTTSDPAAKRAAYLAGKQDGAEQARTGKPVQSPVAKPLGDGEELVVKKDGAPEVRQHSTPTSRYISKDEIPPDTIGIDMTQEDPFIRSAASQAKGEGRALADGGTSGYVPTAQPPAPPVPSAADRARAFARDIVRSDERTKDGFARPSDGEMAKAMRSMDPAVYAYKPEYSPPDQKPGEVNVGPMANAMAKDPVARTAIVRDADSGMLAIDKTKAEKVIMGSLAALQHQVDELQGDVPRAERAKKQRRRGESAANA